MKKVYSLILIGLVSLIYSNQSYCQYAMSSSAKEITPHNNPMTGGVRNYKTFRTQVVDLSQEVLEANKGYEQHPEIGTLYEGAPCADCYEKIGARTEINKVFVRKGTNGKELLEQTSSSAMHYKDAAGNWRTIKSLLEPDLNHVGVYAAYEQPAPVCINTAEKFVSIGKAGAKFQYNNNLELIYLKPDGTTQSLGNANWSNHTAGDEGVYVTNAWPGIDIEMYTLRGAIKTNFLINHALPAYSDGKLLIRDHIQLDGGMTLYPSGQQRYSGNTEIRNGAGDKVYDMSVASVCEKGNIKNTLRTLDYLINGNNFDIEVPGDYLNRPEASYPVIIDPLVSLATSSAVTGSTYSAAWTVGCVYANAATVPANITITDVQFAFTYATASIAWLMDGATDFRKGTCRSPVGATGIGGFYWYCNFPSPGTCASTGGTTYSIYSDLSACIPAPQCPSYNLNLTMDFYQNTGPAPACGSTYIYATTPLVITVIGHTVEFVSATPSPSTICLGSSSTLTGVGTYGVPPYTYTWTPGPVTGSPVTVTPAATTVYTLTITDLCGITATGTTTVTVHIVAPITGTPTVCVGNTTVLADATAGGTWSSSNPGVASVSAGSVVTGVAAGTATITYTVTGCTATMVVTVTPLPGVISGTTTLCVGATSVLADGTAGGTWSSSNPGVASVGAATGLVTAVASGTATITYSLGGSCYVTALVTISPLTAITGPTSVCVGSTIVLSNATAGGTWSSSATGIATVGATTGVVTGVAAGTVTITYTTPSGCSATYTVTINDVAPITGITSICLGSTTLLADATAGGTWTSSTVSVATVGGTTGLVSTVSSGTTTITYTTAAGCTATTLVTVGALASITGTLSVCVSNTTVLVDAAGAGTWSSGSPGIATVGAATGVVTGVSAGTAVITFTTASGCSATASVVVNGIPVITGTTSVCVGNTTVLGSSVPGGTWSCTGTGIATIAPGTGVVTGVSAGATIVTYISAAGCESTQSITVNPLPDPIAGTLSACQGFTATLTDATAGGTWSSGSTAVATIDPSTGVVTGVSGGTATITYTSPFGCVGTTTFIVNGTPPSITGITSVCVGATTALYNSLAGGTWASANTSIATIDATGIVTGVSAGTATITYTSAAGCFITTNVNVNPLPDAIGGTLSVCENNSSVLTDASTGGTWSSSLTATATIDPATGLATGVSAGTCNITYSVLGCTTTAVFTVNPIPPAITGPGGICVGYSVTLTDAMPGGTWSSNNTTIATIGSTTGIVFGIAPGTDSITYVSASGCITSEPLVVNYVPKISFYVKPDVCIGDSVTVQLTSSSIGILGYVWDFGSASVIAANSNSGGPYLLTWPAAGVYTITVTGTTSVLCPSLTVEDTVKVHSLPNASIQSPVFVNGNSNLCTGDSVLLRAAYFVQGYHYLWTPQHFFEQNDVQNVFGKIETAGYVKLTVGDEFGCMATDSILINAQPCCQVVMPDAFTPNGDGLNDVFRPVGLGTHAVHVFRVMNRWGQCVYETTNTKIGWDGTFNGVPQEIGTYYYFFSYDCDGKTIIEKGEATLIR